MKAFWQSYVPLASKDIRFSFCRKHYLSLCSRSDFVHSDEGSKRRRRSWLRKIDPSKLSKLPVLRKAVILPHHFVNKIPTDALSGISATERNPRPFYQNHN